MLNRSALIVRPKQPFLDWALQLDDSGLTPDVDGEQTVYLIPEVDDEAGLEKLLKSIFPEIFERELMSWDTEESSWPQRRTLSLFRQWFELEFHSGVEDLGDNEIENDED